MKAKYETSESWVQRESQFLKDNGFNGTGAWSDVDMMRQMAHPLVFTVIVNPMGRYKSDHIRKYKCGSGP